MSLTTALFLSLRLRRAELGWDRAMRRRGYRDDPDEAAEIGRPFTDRDWSLYNWADNWRLITHRYENALDELDEVKSRRAADAAYVVLDEPVYAEAEAKTESLASHMRDLLGAIPADSKDPS